MKKVDFEIRDLTSNELLDTVEGKNEADIRFVEWQKKYPKRKLWLKMESK